MRWWACLYLHLLLWVCAGPALPVCRNPGWSPSRWSWKARFLALQRERCTHSKKENSHLSNVFITVQAKFVHCKINGLDPFHQFGFQTNSMHADNITSFPGRCVESNYLNRSISNKQNLMFLLQLRRFGWHRFGGLLQSSSLQLPCISPIISLIMIITLMNVFWFQEFRSNTDDTIFKT